MHWLSFEDTESRWFRFMRRLSSPNSDALIDKIDERVLRRRVFDVAFSVFVAGAGFAGGGCCLLAVGGTDDRGVESYEGEELDIVSAAVTMLLTLSVCALLWKLSRDGLRILSAFGDDDTRIGDRPPDVAGVGVGVSSRGG